MRSAIENQRLAEMEAARRFTQAVIANETLGKISETALSMAATHIYSILVEYPREVLLRKIAENPGELVKLLNAFARITDLGLKQAKESNQTAQKNPDGITPTVQEQCQSGLNLL